ncbi:MAG: hypothetical protein QNJ55_16885 [Xenococcus sp. MO_188.B8]|nr:hypothetical protein [Xenococcus sp. MO_188.B8]
MPYLSLIFVFLSALLAIRGSTWDSSRRGFRRLTTIGWGAAILALASFFVSVAITRQSIEDAERIRKEISAARQNASMAAEEAESLQQKLETYQSIVENIKSYAERQEQVVMTQAVTLRLNEIWNAPNKLYPGSKVVVFFFKGLRLVLSYGGRSQELLKGDDGFASAFVIGESGEELKWTLKNSSSDSYEGKVIVYSTPRSRSSDWSWLEEEIHKLPNRP